jgi:hypothetical protein
MNNFLSLTNVSLLILNFLEDGKGGGFSRFLKKEFTLALTPTNDALKEK